MKELEARLHMGIYEDEQIHTKTGFRPIKLQESQSDPHTNRTPSNNPNYHQYLYSPIHLHFQMTVFCTFLRSQLHFADVGILEHKGNFSDIDSIAFSNYLSTSTDFFRLLSLFLYCKPPFCFLLLTGCLLLMVGVLDLVL